MNFCYVRSSGVGNKINLPNSLTQKEPTDGEICRPCFQKVNLIHEFYIRIESIYEQTNKNRIVSSILNVKEENVEGCDEMGGFVDSESSFKCEPEYLEDSIEGTEN